MNSNMSYKDSVAKIWDCLKMSHNVIRYQSLWSIYQHEFQYFSKIQERNFSLVSCLFSFSWGKRLRKCLRTISDTNVCDQWDIKLNCFSKIQRRVNLDFTIISCFSNASPEKNTFFNQINQEFSIKIHYELYKFNTSSLNCLKGILGETSETSNQVFSY